MTFTQAILTMLVALIVWRIVTFIVAGTYIGGAAISEKWQDRKSEQAWQKAERSMKLRESARDPYYANMLLDEKFRPFLDEIGIALRSYAIRDYQDTVVPCDFPEQLSILLTRLRIQSKKAKRTILIPEGQREQARAAEYNLFGIGREHDSVQPRRSTQL